MKRFLLLSALAVFVLAVCIYAFIPSQLKITNVKITAVNSDAAFRLIGNPANWQKWINEPNVSATGTSKDNAFTYHNVTYSIDEILHNVLRISIKNGDNITSSILTLIPTAKDTTAIHWESEIATSNNPLQKVQGYQRAVAVKKNMEDVLYRLNTYLSKEENVYGMKFTIASTNDTILIAKKTMEADYPSTNALYASVNAIRNFVEKKGAKQIAPPMLNITRQDDGKYQMMVALPIDKKIVAEGSFLKRQLVAGNFLITEVQGGPAIINHALDMMQLYISEMGKTSMAIPFEVIITDRLQQPDSTQWLTKIYFPIVR